MSAIEKYNHRSTKVFDVDLKKITTWHKAKDLCGKTIPIIALGYHKSKNPSYADSVFAVINETQGINLPSWHKESVKAILEDEDAINEIKKGLVAIELTELVIKNGTKTVDVTYVENTPF